MIIGLKTLLAWSRPFLEFICGDGSMLTVTHCPGYLPISASTRAYGLPATRCAQKKTLVADQDAPLKAFIIQLFGAQSRP